MVAVFSLPAPAGLPQPTRMVCSACVTGALAWNADQLSSGSRDRMILQRDIRTPPLQSERRLQGHRQEVCGLKWSTDHQLLASGGNDNKVSYFQGVLQGSVSPGLHPEMSDLLSLRIFSLSERGFCFSCSNINRAKLPLGLLSLIKLKRQIKFYFCIWLIKSVASLGGLSSTKLLLSYTS